MVKELISDRTYLKEALKYSLRLFNYSKLDRASFNDEIYIITVYLLSKDVKLFIIPKAFKIGTEHTDTNLLQILVSLSAFCEEYKKLNDETKKNITKELFTDEEYKKLNKICQIAYNTELYEALPYILLSVFKLKYPNKDELYDTLQTSNILKSIFEAKNLESFNIYVNIYIHDELNELLTNVEKAKQYFNLDKSFWEISTELLMRNKFIIDSEPPKKISKFNIFEMMSPKIDIDTLFNL